jgi:type IV pilus assembly protein PilA
MKKFIQNKLKDQKGLTLIELLAVIVILAIIAAIAIPAIGNIIENSRYSAVKSDALNSLSAANIYFAENPEKTEVLISDLSAGYLDNAGELNETKVETNKITKTGGTLAITHGAITYSGSKKVSFNNASVEIINADTRKGSDTGDKTIGGN